ncbi:hypothetical protein ruthe_02283 [Rubellimicrobium thermophilum DSM 16684]|uniref:Uncharacterized protein n=1 Tax=Rubellimicrobium thermophilum DSM 16684 TaxID=1123069 RepID=S9QXN4_9RHOB|nr:hypothetical protein ruthe_02283 [Rubellimicrobium thermophilum DSM 16684]
MRGTLLLQVSELPLKFNCQRAYRVFGSGFAGGTGVSGAGPRGRRAGRCDIG